jgi:hypothetical protein
MVGALVEDRFVTIAARHRILPDQHGETRINSTGLHPIKFEQRKRIVLILTMVQAISVSGMATTGMQIWIGQRRTLGFGKSRDYSISVFFVG